MISRWHCLKELLIKRKSYETKNVFTGYAVNQHLLALLTKTDRGRP